MSTKRTPPDSHSLFPNLPPIPRAPRRNRKKLGIPKGLDLKKYERDEVDGRLCELVGPWTLKKHSILESYVGYTRGVRKNWISKWRAGATYIDPFCGPGQVRIRGTDTGRPGSPMVVWNARGFGPFTGMYVGDMHEDLAKDCEARLRNAQAPVTHFVGPANETVDKIIATIDKNSYHFVFLNPFDLGSLSFDVIRKLARLRAVDILAHVSVLDLNRNLRLYIEEQGSSLDQFAPGWRDMVNTAMPDELVRTEIMAHWKGLWATIDMELADARPLVSGTGGQPLYWLAFASRHKLGHSFWKSIQPPAPPTQETLAY